MNRQIALMSLIALTLSACASLESTPCATLAANAAYCLQPPSARGAFSALQQVDLHWQQVRQTTLTELESDGTALHMAVLSPMGQKLLEVHYRPPQVKQVAGPPSGLEPALLLALVQLALWPQDSVRTGLRGDATWQEQAGLRQLRLDGAVLLEVSYEGDLPYPRHLVLRWPQQQLELVIRTIPDEGSS